MSQAKKPLVSIIVPVYNRDKLIVETIQSLICQTYSNIEIIVIDDASSDGTWKILEGFEKTTLNLKILSHEVNRGESASINTGFRISQGEYVSVVSSDDPQELGWIEAMIEEIELFPGYLF